MVNKYRLKVYPYYCGTEVYRNIEVCGEETLTDLCFIILEAFDFYDDDHLFEFIMDNKRRSEDTYQFLPDDYERSTDISLDEIGLFKGKKFTLHFDYGDNWYFMIRVTSIKEVNAKFEPTLIGEKGEIKQYPDIEEWV